jgi:hypothetical protein
MGLWEPMKEEPKEESLVKWMGLLKQREEETKVVRQYALEYFADQRNRQELD